jgi:ribose transport system ATP-binding protein
MDCGFAYVPEDRASESVFQDLSVSENLFVASLGSLWGGLRLRRRLEAKTAKASVAEYRIKCRDAASSMFTLSGGNQQKAILARWLRRAPSVLLLDEPTHGVDVGAREDIYALIRAAAAEGMSVLVVSSDAEELEALCDRVLMMKRGRIVEEVSTSAVSAEMIEGMV